MTTDALGKSILKRLSNLSRERGVVFQYILTEFLIERMVARLVSSPSTSRVFIFKGGYVSQRIYGSPRYTVDLDALIQSGSPASIEEELINAIQESSEDGVWFRFEKKIDLITQGEYPGLRYAFRAGVGEILPEIRRAQLINFDIGVGDAVTPVEGELQPLLARDAFSWLVYPREVIIAEKLHAFLSRPLENSRSKDLFDLQFHLPMADPRSVIEATRKTLARRGEQPIHDIPKAFSEIRTETLRKGWTSAISGLVNPPSFDDSFEFVLGQLRSIFS